MKNGNLKTRVRKLNIQHDKIEAVDIWLFCDEERELVESTSRKIQHMKWRHLRNFTAYIQSGYKGLKCAKEFGIDHVTLIHSIRKMCDALEVRQTSDPLYQVYCKMVQNYGHINTLKDCAGEKEVAGMCILENVGV